MNPMKNEVAQRPAHSSVLPGVVLILLLGVALGLLHNLIGLKSQPAYGVDWKMG